MMVYVVTFSPVSIDEHGNALELPDKEIMRVCKSRSGAERFVLHKMIWHEETGNSIARWQYQIVPKTLKS